MTEAEWMACAEPRLLLDYHRMKKAPRRLRLLAAACVRLTVTADAPALASQVIDVVERHADGLALRAEFLAARKAVRNAIKDGTEAPSVLALRNLTNDEMEGMTVTISNLSARIGSSGCGLIRCVFGNPFRPVAFSPSWRTDTAVALAQQMYESREFGTMPILADALQDAGCDSEDILTHCRDANQPHVRGCWVVDLVLGKE